MTHVRLKFGEDSKMPVCFFFCLRVLIIFSMAFIKSRCNRWLVGGLDSVGYLRLFRIRQLILMSCRLGTQGPLPPRVH